VDGPALSRGGGAKPSGGGFKRWLARLAAWVLASPRRSAWLGSFVRWVGTRAPGLLRLGPLAGWSNTRELPPLPRQSFQASYAARRGRGHTEAGRRSMSKGAGP
jgi:hypothetical protein